MKMFVFGPEHEMIASTSKGYPEDAAEKGTVEIRGAGGGLPMDQNHDLIVAAPEYLRRLVAAVRSLQKECAWQPLDTAPKQPVGEPGNPDGPLVLLRLQELGGACYVEEGYWRTDYECWCSESLQGSALTWTPTHWRPKPLP